MLLPLDTDDVTVLPSTTTEDPTTGNDSLTYPDPATAATVRGSFQPQSSTEDVSGKDQVIATYRVFLPGGVALKSTDRLLSGGVLVEVDGAPQVWPSPFGGVDHIEANAKVVTG
jgi:hypothetical protein